MNDHMNVNDRHPNQGGIVLGHVTYEHVDDELLCQGCAGTTATTESKPSPPCGGNDTRRKAMPDLDDLANTYRRRAVNLTSLAGQRPASLDADAHDLVGAQLADQAADWQALAALLDATWEATWDPIMERHDPDTIAALTAAAERLANRL